MAKRRRQTKAAGAGRRHITNREEAAMDPVLPPLPDEVAEDIFVRLPVKSLAASRCVSPSWNGLISSLTFARHHREAALARAGVAPRFVSVPIDRDAHNHLRVASPRDTTPQPSPCAGCPRVFSGAGGACHGAILVGRPCKGEFFVCNPSTGGELRLPPRRPPWYFHSAGLGYDDAGRHKAVLLERDADHPPPRWWVPRLQCSVFSVGGQWRWRAPRGRRTPIIFHDALVSANMDPVFADGRLHWMLVSREEENGLRAIQIGFLSFELGSESFRRLPLPPFTDENLPWPEYATMAEVDGRLCLVRDLRRPLRAVSVFEVWMLRDYNPLSWSLDRRIDLTPHIGMELTRPWDGDFFVVCYAGGQSFGESRKVLLATTGPVQRAYMYQPDTGELRTLVWRNDYGVQQQMRLVLYQKSLFQVDGMEYDNKDIKFMFTKQEEERRISASRYLSLFKSIN